MAAMLQDWNFADEALNGTSGPFAHGFPGYWPPGKVGCPKPCSGLYIPLPIMPAEV